jgi:hypothetical protein
MRPFRPAAVAPRRRLAPRLASRLSADRSRRPRAGAFTVFRRPPPQQSPAFARSPAPVARQPAAAPPPPVTSPGYLPPVRAAAFVQRVVDPSWPPALTLIRESQIMATTDTPLSVQRNMKRVVIWALLLLSDSACADPFEAAPTVENSVPRGVWIEYCESDGNAFRLVRRVSLCENPGRIDTRYSLNWQFDENAEEKDIEIPPAAWVRFREALRKLRCDTWTEQKFDDQKVKTFWRLSIGYPDVEIRAAAAETVTLRRDFEPIRMAIRELTEGVVFCRCDRKEIGPDKRPEGTPGKCSPSNASQPPVVPHP